MFEPETVGAALLQLLQERQMTQADLHRATGVHRSKISQYCSGKAMPRLDTLDRLLAGMDVSPEEFLAALGAEPPQPQGGNGQLEVTVELFRSLRARLESVEHQLEDLLLRLPLQRK